MTVLTAALVLFGITLVFAALLGVAKEKLRVEEDPRIPQVLDALPAANCGGCGFAGCADFAKAVVEQRAACDGCPVGGSATARRIAGILGVEVVPTFPYRAVCRCGARTQDKLGVVPYEGVESCVEANIVGVTQGCIYGCLGYGDCEPACPFDAIRMVDGKPVVDYELCTGCGACVKACPRGLFELIPFKQERMLVIACNNKEPTKAVREVCKVGCIGCKLCQRLAPAIFQVENNLARVRYDTYTGEETEEITRALEKCPAEVMLYFGKPPPPEAPAGEARAPAAAATPGP